MDEIRIGSHILQPHRQLLLDGEHVHLGPRALSILTVLCEADGEIVTKDEIMEAVWPDVTVEENALQVHVTALRKALGADAGLLHTLRGIGYQLETGEETRPEETSRPGADDGPSSPSRPIRSKPRRPVLIMAGLGLLVILAAFSTVFVSRSGESSPPSQQAPTSLAVLPFQISGDEEWRGREKALTASISSNLARVPNIELVSDTAITALDGQALSPLQIGKRLGVDHFIEGDVLASDERLVSQVRLVEARSGRAIWSGEIVGERRHPDEFEALLLTRISGTLLALRRLASGEQEIPEGIDPRAYEAFLDGLAYLTARDGGDWQHSFRQMQLATSIEPDFPAAHAGAAFVLASGTNGTFSSMSREEYIDLYTKLRARALELDPDSFEAQLAHGIFLLHTHGEITAALEIGENLLKRRPEDARVNAFMHAALYFAGRPREAVTYLDRAISADPFNRQWERFRRNSLTMAGDYYAVRRSALECTVDCWFAAYQWWGALLRYGALFDYRRDIDTIAEMAEDERAFYSGELGQARSIQLHSKFIFLDQRDYVEWEVDDRGTLPPSDFLQILFLYGFVDEAFTLVNRYDFSRAGVGVVMPLFAGGRLTAPEAVLADPRYAAIFEMPHLKAVADYRREHGVTEGLPSLP